MIDKAVQLLKVVTAKTVRGEIDWSQVVNNTFRTSVAKGLIRVSKYYEEDYGHEVIEVAISDAGARVIEDDRLNEGSPHFDVVLALFEAARRSALSVDEALDKMLESLSAK